MIIQDSTVNALEEYSTSYKINHASMSKEERRKKRQKWKSKDDQQGTSNGAPSKNDAVADERFTTLLARNEDELLQFVAKVNKVYQELLKKPLHS